MAVGGEHDAHRDRHLQGFPDAGRHAPADQLAAVAHRARLGVALGPAERLRALAVAFAQLLAAVGLVSCLVAIRIAPQAQLERIELERDGELVHRAFERIDAGAAPGARMSHGSEIEPRELVLELRVGALVEQARPAGLLPMEVLVLRGHGDRVVRDRVERSVGVGAERHALDHRGPVAELIHLLPGQHDPHRALAARAPPARPAPPGIAGAAPSRTPPPKGDMTRTSSGFMPNTPQR